MKLRNSNMLMLSRRAKRK